MAATRTTNEDDAAAELTSAQVRTLRRRIADLDDETRYLLVSRMAPRFDLYYNISDDVYVMNDPRYATMFKRRKAALAVKILLGDSIQVIRCLSKRVAGVLTPILNKTSRTGRRASR
jgi:hypothetical protein